MKFTNIVFERAEIPNIKAIMCGRQIILCKNKPVNYKDSDIVFLVSSDATGKPKGNRKPRYRLSPKGETFLEEEGEEKIENTNVIVKCHDIKLKIEGSNKKEKLRSFFTKLYKLDIFTLWDIEDGPLEYFKNYDECYLRFYRAFEIPLTVKKNDYSDGYPKIKVTSKDKLLKEINSIDDIYSKPVLLDNDFNKQKNEILDIAKNHGLSDPAVAEAGLKHGQALQKDNMSEILHKKKQIILYGPPGTGKTYNTKKITIDFLNNK